jgi:hypothetical protein
MFLLLERQIKMATFSPQLRLLQQQSHTPSQGSMTKGNAQPYHLSIFIVAALSEGLHSAGQLIDAAS